MFAQRHQLFLVIKLLIFFLTCSIIDLSLFLTYLQSYVKTFLKIFVTI